MRSETTKVVLSVEYVPLPPEREAQWWAAMRWLVELMKEYIQEQDSTSTDG